MAPPDALSVVLPPQTIALFEPAFATGIVLTLTITASVAEHVPLLTVTVYVVVADGLATGFEIFVALKPVAGDHEYVPPPAAFN